ncbi:MAG: MarR family transcriptional regulator [Sphaerochaetaceae bacterium]|nr:MarR family transcriptional regulator [Sphaerochaetaceae bacterium]
MSVIDSMPSREFVFGSILLLSNKLQIAGDGIMDGLTMKQWFLLIMMNILKMENGKETQTVTEVAECTGTSRQNVRKMLDVLARKGFVVLTPSPTDRRALDVGLTERCYAFFARNERIGDKFLDDLYETVTAGELEMVAGVCRKLFARLDAMSTNAERLN